MELTPYQSAIMALATESESAAISLWWQAEALGDDLLAAALAALLATYAGKAATLATTAWAAQASVAIGEPVPAVPVLLPDRDVDRLAKAATAVIQVAAKSPVPEDIVARLFRAEPLKTASDTYHQQLTESKLVQGWTRQMDGDPCQLCRWWWRDGRVWPANHRFQRHTGCACVAGPVWAKHIRSTEQTRKIERTA